MSKRKPSRAELQARLEQAEATLDALRRGEVDILIGPIGPLRIRLKSLIEENERLAQEWQTTFDTVKDAIWVLDAEQRILRANRAAEQTFHCPLAEMPGRRCFEIAHHTDEPIPGCPFRPMRASRQRESFEMQLEDHWYEVTADPILDADGNLVGAVHIASDITERKRTEDYIRHQASLIENVSDAIISTDLNFVIYSWNRAAEAIYGWTEEEVIGKVVGDVIPTEYPDDNRERVLQQFLAEGFWKDEVIQRHKDGTPVNILAAVSFIRDSAGNPTGVVAVNRDITERKRAEDQLRAAHAELQRLLAEAERSRRALLSVVEDQKRVEEALAAERSLLRTLIDHLPVAVYVKDAAGRKTLANPVDVRNIGAASEAEVLGKTDFELFPRALAEAFQADDRYVLETGQPILNREERITRPDGTLGWQLTSKVALRDGSGRVTGLVGIGLDITERKRAGEALERRAAQLALLNEVGSKIAAVSDLESVLERAAHLVHENFRYHHVALYILDRERGDLVMRARAGGFAHIFPPEHRVRLGEGIVGWVGVHGETLLANDVDAEPRYVNFFPGVLPTRSKLCVSIRVGEEIVGVLDVQSDQLNAFDENDVRVLETLAAQVAVAFENARLYRELRQYAEELERRVQERTAQLYSQYARLEAILNSTSDGILVTGSRGQILLTNPVAQTWLTQTLPAADVERLEATVRDLAFRAEERPEAILELTGLDLQLNATPIAESGVEGATAVVAVHDVSQLKALDRLKSQFVSNVSHELRTPVTTIKLYAALLRQSPPEKWPRYLDALEKEADRQARLVEEVLQVSRIDAGRLEIKPQAVNLNGLAEDVVAGHQALAQAHGLALECCMVEPGLVVLVDPDRMMQVLNNLVENAINYTPQGRIEVATGQAEAEGRAWATVRVSDTGMGIPADELPRIFERFFRGEKPRLAGKPGSGLGLAIAREIVELHGGRITVESREGVGSTFTVWLPLAEE